MATRHVVGQTPEAAQGSAHTRKPMLPEYSLKARYEVAYGDIGQGTFGTVHLGRLRDPTSTSRMVRTGQ